jgi:hypothetical protein
MIYLTLSQKQTTNEKKKRLNRSYEMSQTFLSQCLRHQTQYLVSTKVHKNFDSVMGHTFR